MADELSNFLEGIRILKSYELKGGYIGARHEEIRVGSTLKPVQPHDMELLEDLGWLQDEYDAWTFATS